MIDSRSDTVEHCLERMRAAASAGDAQAFAAEFNEDATYVTFFGQFVPGRPDIESFHKTAFAKFPAGTRMLIKTLSVRWLGDNCASVLTIGGIGPGPDVPYDKFQTFAMVRRDERWGCAAFQNTEMNASAKQKYNAAEAASSASAES